MSYTMESDFNRERRNWYVVERSGVGLGCFGMVLWLLVWLSVWGALIFAAIHFIRKFW